jgi:hypothetical protein
MFRPLLGFGLKSIPIIRFAILCVDVAWFGHSIRGRQVSDPDHVAFSALPMETRERHS